MTNTFWFDSGHWTGSGDASGRYWVEGDELFMDWDEFEGPPDHFRFTRDDEGNLTLEPAEPMDPADAFLMTGKPWIKIG